MNRSLKLSMLVALALGSSQLMALDLGQVQVKSALGQPLLAEIPLHPDNPGELKGLTVQLASSEQFERAGIVGGRTKIPLHFSVANAGGAHPVIRITSSVPVDDPFLDLLIQVDGKAGKSVREYAILLDPPGASTPVATVARPAAPSKPEPAKAPVATRATPAAAPAPAPAAVSNGRYGPVQSGQTLSGIAHSVSPAGVDAQQMMLALQQANPDAFYKDNINALKSGAVLRVPTSAEAQAMTLAAAAAEVRRQNSDWRAGMPGKPALVADAAARGTSSGASGASSAGNEDRLALVPPKVGGGTSAQASGGSDKSAASLRDDLLRARENVASLQQQGNDLKARLKDLNEINSKNEHLLSLKNSEIAELQAKLAAARKAAGAPAAEQPGKTAGAEPAAPVEMEPAVATAGSSAEAETVPTTAATSAMATAASVAASGSSMAPAGSAALAAASSVAPAPQAVAPPAAKPVETKPASKPAPAPVKVAEAPWYMQTCSCWPCSADDGSRQQPRPVLHWPIVSAVRRRLTATCSTMRTPTRSNCSTSWPSTRTISTCTWNWSPCITRGATSSASRLRPKRCMRTSPIRSRMNGRMWCTWARISRRSIRCSIITKKRLRPGPRPARVSTSMTTRTRATPRRSSPRCRRHCRRSRSGSANTTSTST
jgi:pilus assembly protein FimV